MKPINRILIAIKAFLPVPDEYHLIDLSQDIRALCDHLAIDYEVYSGGCFFVLIDEGEYESVYYCDHNIPHLSYNVERIL